MEKMKPGDIEKRSFAIITEELEERGKILDPAYEHVIKRCIHTTADFEYADSLYFSDGVLEKFEEAIKNGATIVTDTNMAKSGISKSFIEKAGGRVSCFMADKDVAEEAVLRGSTRAAVSMEKASKIEGPVIFVIGNAPTAIDAICRLHREDGMNPVGVIGVPVGFVNVVEAKEELIDSDIPCIVARGRKGGSNVAAAIVNAIQYKIYRD
jgi:precorrin-8X/cobalt-precorrin-8 methylmutase